MCGEGRAEEGSWVWFVSSDEQWEEGFAVAAVEEQ